VVATSVPSVSHDSNTTVGVFHASAAPALPAVSSPIVCAGSLVSLAGSALSAVVSVVTGSEAGAPVSIIWSSVRSSRPVVSLFLLLCFVRL
jgi:hypothetical protein